MESRLNSLLQNKRLKRLARVGIFGLLIWFGLFRWNVFDGYGKGLDDKPFFSPNCEYSVTLHQTVWERLFYSSWPYMTSTARLHNKAGEVLYEGKTDYDEHDPLWFGSEVSMRGLGPNGDWVFKLPSPPGDELKARNCAKLDEETQELKAMTQQPELNMPFGECSVKFSNVFQGWFLRGRYSNSDVASYEGISSIDGKAKVEIRFVCLKEQEHREIWDDVPVRGSIKAVNAIGGYQLKFGNQGGISFRGCLPNGKHVFCANVYPIGNKNSPDHDLTQKMLELLQSVEFVPDPNQGQQ